MNYHNRYIAEYIAFVLQPVPINNVPQSPVTVIFTNEEAKNVFHTKGVDLLTYTNELGLGGTTVKKNGLTFDFKINVNYRDITRQKVETLLYYIQTGCDVTFTLHTYQSFVPTFEQNPNFVPNDVHTYSVTLDYASVNIVNKQLDNTFRGKGLILGEIGFLDITVKEAVNPLDFMPCKRLSANDYSRTPFILDFDGTGNYIYVVNVDLNTSGLIEKFLDYPEEGTFQLVGFPTTNPLFLNTFTITNSHLDYGDSLISTYVTSGQTYIVRIIDIPVLLKTGERCKLTFEQTYTIP